MDISGAGSTFVYPVLAKWAADYAVKTGNHVNYQSIGSGGGIAQIKAATVDFGATDKPLDPDTLAKLGLGQFPLVIGGIVPVINLDGIAPGQLKLSGAVIADIYLGKIRGWNDPAIAALNPGVKLPDTKISVVHRSDGSGTTFNFANFLSKVSPEWKTKVGADTSISWPTGIGGKGNEGVAAYTKQIKGAIGYVEYAYVLQNHMTYTLVQNSAGKFMKPDAKSFQDAAATADWVHSKDFYLIMTNAPGAGGLSDRGHRVHADVQNAERRRRGKRRRSISSPGRCATVRRKPKSLDYVPLPQSLVTQIAAYWTRPF